MTPREHYQQETGLFAYNSELEPSKQYATWLEHKLRDFPTPQTREEHPSKQEYIKSISGSIIPSMKSPDPIPIEWQQIWHEIQMWYGDAKQLETPEQLITRLMKGFALSLQQPQVQPLMEEQVDKPIKKNGELYTFYKVEYEHCWPEYDYTICETLDEVKEAIDVVDTDLDEIDSRSKVIITGIGLTQEQYKKWQDSIPGDNIDELFLNHGFEACKNCHNWQPKDSK